MEAKKTFFASLEPKSAFLVGITGGILTLGTIGFIVLGVMILNGGINLSASAKGSAAVAKANKSPAATAPNQVQAPQVQKSDRPKVELFVMSYCPYGLQMEKAFLPAWQLLKDKADMNVKFVSYAMHGLKEIEENTRQYCIQATQKEKYITYLKCFTGKDDYAGCLRAAGIDEGTLGGCVNTINKQFGIMEKYNDQKTWLSGRYPQYPVHAGLNDQYGVQGSPTLVINGVQAEAPRTAEGVKTAVCAAFNNPPAECGQTLSSTSYDPGFGLSASGGGANNAAGCGS